jgi:hypothetical protein
MDGILGTYTAQWACVSGVPIDPERTHGDRGLWSGPLLSVSV